MPQPTSHMLTFAAFSFQHRVRPSRGEVFLDLCCAQPLHHSVYLGVVVVQTRLGIFVLGRQTCNVAILLLGLEARCCRNARVGYARDASRWRRAPIVVLCVLLQYQPSKIQARLLCTGIERRCVAAVGGRDRRAGPRVLLRVDDALLCAVRLGQNLLEVLVATLRRLPVRVAESFVDLVHIERVEERGVSLLVGGGGDGRHRLLGERVV